MGRDTLRRLMPITAASFLLFACVLCTVTSQNSIQLGSSISLFPKYGFLALSIRVLPHNDSGGWIFRETTTKVLNDTSFQVVEENYTNNTFDHHFHLEFCDDSIELLEAYFRKFTVEGMEKPWRAFASGFRRSWLARHLGLEFQFFSNHYSYILIKLYKVDSSTHIVGAPSAGLEFQTAVNNTKDGDRWTMIQILEKFGTHYISSYKIGDVIYQVFVYPPKVFRNIKDRVHSVGIGNVLPLELYSYFSPWYASHIGKVLVASGNDLVNRWVQDRFVVNYYMKTYPSIFRIHDDSALLSALEDILGGEAVISLDLKFLVQVYNDSEKMWWFREVLDNTLKIWEMNM